MAKLLKWFFAVLLLVLIIYFIGPSATDPVLTTDLPEVNGNLLQLESEINKSEKAMPGMKADNQARIVWFDSLHKSKTPISIVYLHGFSASQEEGMPLHRDFARGMAVTFIWRDCTNMAWRTKKPL